jgi:hypothetical protein
MKISNDTYPDRLMNGLIRYRFNLDRRSGKDRRDQSGMNIRALMRGGKRETIRRKDDTQKRFWVDQYSSILFALIVIILFLSIVDALLTLILIDNGAAEMNPIMAYYLKIGPYTFLAVKYTLTSIGVISLLIFRNVFLRIIKIYTHSLFYIIIAVFMTVVMWEFYLIFNIMS